MHDTSIRDVCYVELDVCLTVQVCIYLRWAQWLLNVRLKQKKVVIINMDETSVNTQNATKHGMHVSTPHCRFRSDEAPTKKPRSMPCTLLGTVCNIDVIQEQLPQVLLPKYVKNASPPDAIKTAFAETGAPLEAWHKTGGWNNHGTMVTWLRKLHRHVRDHDKDLNIILVLDCATAHLNEKVLKVARTLKVNILMVPSKCTWFMQPLDVYSFAHLKRSLRKKLAKEEILSTTGNVSNLNKIRVIGEAVQEELVGQSWNDRMAKVGLSSDLSMCRDPLKRITRGMDLTARPPTKEELGCVLSKECRQNRVPWHTLLLSDFAESSGLLPQPCEITPGVATHVEGHQHPEQPQLASTSSASSSSSTSAIGLSEQILRSVPTGVPIHAKRLPSAVNFDFSPDPMPRVGPSAGTRSRTKKNPKATKVSSLPNSNL